jgi:hypothetical protein
MEERKSWSQVGQDLWALENSGDNHTFLDIGCMEPFACNNTYILELADWKGLAIDFADLFISSWGQHRKCPAICVNALEVDWKTVLPANGLPLEIGYVSLDLYGEELQVLQNLAAAGVTFRCATVEHDGHSEQRAAIREFLLAEGYTLAVPDVLSPSAIINEKPVAGTPFEDWWTK